VVLGITTLEGLGGSFLITGVTFGFIDTNDFGSTTPFFNGFGGGSGFTALAGGFAAGFGAGLGGCLGAGLLAPVPICFLGGGGVFLGADFFTVFFAAGFFTAAFFPGLGLAAFLETCFFLLAIELPFF
jgi:hypothetical protein